MRKGIAVAFVLWLSVMLASLSTHYGTSPLRWFTPIDSLLPVALGYHIAVILLIVIESYDHKNRRIFDSHRSFLIARSFINLILTILFVWEFDPVRFIIVYLYGVGWFGILFDPLRNYFNTNNTFNEFNFFYRGNQSYTQSRILPRCPIMYYFLKCLYFIVIITWLIFEYGSF
jgi:hypothetical protein